MAPQLAEVLPRAARADAGRARRDEVPREAHAELGATAGRADPLAILRAQDSTRVEELVPIRYGRMLATPFTFYRGAAAVMAADLAPLPRTDIDVQLCGDAHLANFGAFAAPDRRIVADVNDFDETLPGPFEWDVKRLAASLVLAARDNDLGPAVEQAVVTDTVRVYREALAIAAGMDPLDVWYARVELDDLAAVASTEKDADLDRRVRKAETKAKRKDRRRAAERLTEVVDGRRRIVHAPPITVRPEPEQVEAELARIVTFLDAYRDGLPLDRQQVLASYRLVDAARRVVGVGSVGTRCWILLLESGDGDPLFLQLKEATSSVLEAHLAPSPFENSGQRVVEGQRLTQAASDVLLGWSRFEASDGRAIDFYFRQLWDGKLSIDVSRMGARRLRRYGRFCGLVLARAHARSGDPAEVSGYLGDDDVFDRAIGDFARKYADRNDADHSRMLEAVKGGELVATPDI